MLPNLRGLDLWGMRHAPAVVLQALTRAPRLYSFVNITLPNGGPSTAFYDVASVLQVLSTLPQLKSLSLGGGPSSSWPAPSAVLDLARLSSLTRLTSLTLQLPAPEAAGGAEGQVQAAPPRYKLPPKLKVLFLCHVAPTVLASLEAPPGLRRVDGSGDTQPPFCIRFSPLEYSVAVDEDNAFGMAMQCARVRPTAAAAVAAAFSFLAATEVPCHLEMQAPIIGGGMLMHPAAEPDAVAGGAGGVRGGHASWLAAMGNAPVTWLALKGIALDALDLEALVQHCPLLKALMIDKCAVSPAALPCLLGLPKLTWLGVQLSRCHAQDEVLAALEQLALGPSPLLTLQVLPVQGEAQAQGGRLWEEAWLDGEMARLGAEAEARGLGRSVTRWTE
ncbi:hypothetical protein HYH03_010635 [Edaphochlamys debaryana]|uniref:Uncharacterized protein n=1 Tax=Edaphochlamys debaryana TaxID=47281 RepID=A0A835XXR2_9CHLO|nr:hypothetical protein HYH03_010635 [Edaphochlamys debaryana]|eukprot:KAG2490958.1 hypothetical protein HYH03_010635 [Edaphochlamys debaryana]